MAGARTPRLSLRSPWRNTARECTLRLPFWIRHFVLLVFSITVTLCIAFQGAMSFSPTGKSTYAPSLELVLYTTRQFPYAPSGAGNLTTSWQLVFRTEISLSLERTPFEGQVVHDRSLAIERFPQTASHAKHLTTAPLIHDSKLRLTLRPSLLRSAVNRGTRIITLQELSKAVAAAYIERTIRGTNPRPTFDVWAHNLSSEATQGKASAVADKRLPNHWAKDFWLRV
jgi:hypothetical protein